MTVKRVGMGESPETIKFFSKIFQLPESSCSSWFLERQDAFLEGTLRGYKILEEGQMIGCAVVKLLDENKATLEAFAITEKAESDKALTEVYKLLKTFKYELVLVEETKV